MATEQHEDLEIVEEHPQQHQQNKNLKRKNLVHTTQIKPPSFLEKMHNYKPYAIEEAYTVLISEYHHALCEIKEYF